MGFFMFDGMDHGWMACMGLDGNRLIRTVMFFNAHTIKISVHCANEEMGTAVVVLFGNIST